MNFNLRDILQKKEEPIGSRLSDEQLEKYVADNIRWLGHASIQVTDHERTLYFDPFGLDHKEKPADVILVSHNHFDHASSEDIGKLVKEGTVVIGDEATKRKLDRYIIDSADYVLIKSGRNVAVSGIEVRAVDAYNPCKEEHPKGEGIGFVVNMSGVVLYYAGDTDFIPEMKRLRGIDVAFYPVGGGATMDVREAAQAVNAMKPRIAIPMHYGSQFTDSQGDFEIGRLEDGLKFEKLVESQSSTKVLVLQRNRASNRYMAPF